MASLEHHSSGVYRTRFRFGGRQWYRSLEIDDKQEAEQIRSRIERTLHLLKCGDIALPPNLTDDETFLFIRSGGRISGEYAVPVAITLGEASDKYFADIPPGAKEKSSIDTERLHAKHLKEILRSSTALEAIGVDKLQSYINRRTKKSVAPYTIQKELGTYHQIWCHAKARNLVAADYPQKKALRFPKSPEKPPFQTFDQIEKAIAGGAEEKLWEALFLREKEVLEVLEYVDQLNTHPFIYPMVAFAALSGARRSEILRSQTTDWMFDSGVVLIREKKRVKTASLSFRRVDMPAKLISIMRPWIEENHPGGQFTICKEPGCEMSKDSARGYLERALRRHDKWSKIRGFHTFRHSFASICAMKGIHPSIIDGWLGHQTEEMRRRYRHLFPEETHAARIMLFNDEAEQQSDAAAD
jgi:integrase